MQLYDETSGDAVHGRATIMPVRPLPSGEYLDTRMQTIETNFNGIVQALRGLISEMQMSNDTRVIYENAPLAMRPIRVMQNKFGNYERILTDLASAVIIQHRRFADDAYPV